MVNNMKKICVLLACLTSTLVLAEPDNGLYKTYLDKSISLEKKYKLECQSKQNVDDFSTCASRINKSYDALILDIRRNHHLRTNTKLWQYMTTNYAKSGDSCSSPLTNYHTNEVYSPYLECMHAVTHAFYIATINVHFQQ